MNLKRSLSIIIIVALPVVCSAQIVVVGLPHSKGQTTTPKKTSNARTKAIELPFWEDFSSTRTSYANPDLWANGRQIRVNNGMAIRPPSIGVATFDGVDSVGKPYNVNDVLAKGFADILESNEIDLTTVDESLRNTVYLSFMYQMQGHGELPDAGDRLQLSFLDDQGGWIPVAVIENDGTLQPDLFYNSIVQINDPKYYHPGFKFRIQNFSRLSGPYDTWNVDYIYLNKGRSANDLSFPDRTISEPLSSLFGIYRIMPVDHFLFEPTMTRPSVVATNLRANNPQPVNVSSKAKITYRQNQAIFTKEQTLDNAFEFNEPLLKGTFTTVSTENLPDINDLLTESDSIGIELTFSLNTKDNIVISPTEGDYDPAIYSPIDFRSNDTTRASYLLLNKYAYDDGTAEYGAGLNQPGAQVAYEYNLVGKSEEYITYIEMLFPRFGDESSQVIELRVWTDLEEEPVYKEVVALQRSEKGEYWVKRIRPTAVGKKFYIGWKQNSAAVIAVGLDKNTDTGDKMFSNTGGEWIQNTIVQGSLMLHPIFGEGIPDDPNGLEQETTLTVYPNPSTGTFRFGGVADQINVYDMTGRTVGFQHETTQDETIVALANTASGIYIIKAYIGGVIRTAKVMVRE